jgi:hypothetical protein
MQCKPGFHGPLCAICKDGHYEQLGNCVECSKPRFLAIFLFVLGFVVGLAFLRFLYKYRKVIVAMQVGANLKVIMSFVTVLSTVGAQFGVVWPSVSRLKCSI